MTNTVRRILFLAAALVAGGLAGCSAAYSGQKSPMEITGAGPGCGASKFGPGEYYREIESGGRDRSYKIHVPPAYTPGKKLPVVLNFHGGGGNADDQEKNSKMNEVSDSEGFIVVYPNGTGPLKKKFLSFNAGMCCGYAKARKVDDVAFVRALLGDLEGHFCVNPKKVYSTGFSNGAIMSHRLACELSDRIAAIAPVSGPIGVDQCTPSRPVPVLEFHGTADPMAPFKGGEMEALVGREKHLYRSMDETISGWVKRNRCDGEAKETLKKGAVSCKTHGNCNGGASVTLCTVEGAGHTWPGGLSTLSEKTAGPVNHDISASRMIWDFFKDKSLP